MYTKEADLYEVEKKFIVHEFPLVIIVEASNYCNLRCTMCSHKDMKRPKGRMAMSLYRKVIDEIATENPYSRLWLAWSGEPLIEGWRLYYMITYAKRKGLQSVNINTNGQLLNDEMADMLIDSGIDNVHIDIDAFSKEVYEKIRVGGDRDRLYKNVENFLQKLEKTEGKKPQVNLKIIEMDINRGEVEKVIEYWKKYDVTFEITEAHTWAGKVEEQMDIERDRIACCYAVGHFEISWDGRCAACSPDTEIVNEIGNVVDKTIKDVWQYRVNNIISIHMNHEWDKLPDLCRNCTDWMHIGTENRFYSSGGEYVRNYDPNKTY